MDPRLRERLFSRLHDILAAHPAGLAEYRLLELLNAEALPCFVGSNRHDPLDLFRRHFLLFHLLYGLRDRLRAEGRGDLAIHCLGIVLLPPPATPVPPDALAPFEPLRAYYLDLDRMREVDRAEVEEMLERFWRLYAGHQDREEALAVFGLAGEVDPQAIKARYRRLAREHHPDAGGDPERFRAVQAAAEILLP